MSNPEREEVRQFWNSLADDWLIQVGADGDANRILNSDPVLWAFLGDVRGLRVLDAGCGTGYLSSKLHGRGAIVTGIDLSDRMIEIARGRNPNIDFRVESCSELTSIEDEYFDKIASNYMLMDTPDLLGTVNALHRVLKTGGIAVLVFSHPCFPQDWATVSEKGEISYRWPFSYFESRKCFGSPWAHFKSDFIWFRGRYLSTGRPSSALDLPWWTWRNPE